MKWVSVEPELFVKIYNNLKSSATIDMLVGGRVFDCVQKDVEYPYIVVGETNVTEQPSMNGMRETVAVTLHVYSQATTTYQTRDILKYLNILARENVDIEDYELDWVQKDNSDVFIDIDQHTKHGVLRLLFRFRHKTLQEGV